MSDEPVEFTALMSRAQGGCPEATATPVERYGHQILRVIRRGLHPRVRRLLDPADVVQDVWGSFFAGPSRRHTFEAHAHLLAFLRRLTRNKVVEANRKHLDCQKSSLRRQQPLDGLGVVEGRDLVARLPSPGEVALAKDDWEQLLRGRPASDCRMLSLLRDGHTQRETAAQVGVDESTVRRVVARARAAAG
jgi:DNA-directed RNA polymerase specialized sigma24 family protein